MGGSGADVGPLKIRELFSQVFVQIQRYFDYHHASNDTFDAVNKETRVRSCYNGFIECICLLSTVR
jgi:hypothetical protein